MTWTRKRAKRTPEAIHPPFRLGESVRDDLTTHMSTVIGLMYEDGKRAFSANTVSAGTWGVVINDEYLDGLRHPWEVERA